MKKAVMYGAGNVGRGFLGQLFSESDYEVVFIDIAPALLAALNERSYRLRLVSNESSQDVLVKNVRAVSGQDVEAVAAEIASADIMATAVGANVLPRIAPAIAAGLARRARLADPRPLNIIVCENLKDAPRILYGYLEARLQQASLPAEHRAQALAYLATQVGLIDAVIGRMVPLVPPELQQQDPSLVLAEPYKVLPVNRAGFIGEIPAIVGLEAHDHFGAYVDRKLYLHNAGHAMLGYLGHLKGLTYGYEALEDADIRPWLSRALNESQRALAAAHGLDAVKLEAHVQDLLHRFANRALGDTVFRLARDPLRKLGKSDRLVGAALLALAQGIRPEALAQGIRPEALAAGIAAALAFDDAQDPAALELQKRIAERGLDAILSELCGLEPQDELAQMVKARRADIQQGRLWV